MRCLVSAVAERVQGWLLRSGPAWDLRYRLAGLLDPLIVDRWARDPCRRLPNAEEDEPDGGWTG